MSGSYPAGVTDNDPHFRDDTEPDDEPEPDESLFAAEVFGEPWPKDSTESSQPIPKELWACIV